MQKTLSKINALAAVGCLCLFSVGCDRSKEIKTAAQKGMERAYFEGQRDAIEGDVRINRDETNKCYRWSKSPWDDRTAPLTDVSGIPDKKR